LEAGESSENRSREKKSGADWNTYRTSFGSPTTIISLAERLSSMETFEPDGRSFPANGKDWRLSFNPVGEWMPPATHEVPVAAFEISKTKRIREFFPLILD
jgi:hypothetical protein